MTDPTPPAPGPANLFEPDDVVWTRVSSRLATARLILLALWFGLAVIVLLVAALAAESAWMWALVGVVIVVGLWCGFVIRRQVPVMGYAERDDDLLFRKGLAFRSLVVVPYGRMQSVDVQAGPLARRLRIATVQLHTASAGTDASIAGLELAEAERLRDRLASRGEARLAGL